jgi:hypothetical protein
VAKAVHPMAYRKQEEEYRKGTGKDKSPKICPQITYFLQLVPTSYFSLPLNNSII